MSKELMVIMDGNAGKKKREIEKTKRMERKENKEYYGIPAQAQNESGTNLYTIGKVKQTIHVAGPDTK